jgi:hypothetical protein
MGLAADHLRFVLLTRDSGVRFDRPLMIGRQELFIDPARLRRILARSGIELTEEGARRLLEEEEGFADPLFRLLGATQVDSMDASSYEGATIVHDLNEPIPPSLRNRYSVVFDSGSLEHVFNIAQAFRNCLEMVEDGGYFISIAPGNNAMGHGFYQFSPELYFRILSPQNGFRIERILVKETHAAARWYAVTDPATIGHRVEWQPLGEVYVMVFARKEHTVDVFRSALQQSDYVTQWSGEAPASTQGAPTRVHHHLNWQSAVPPNSLRALVWQPVPGPAKIAYRSLKRLSALFGRALSQPDPACFTRLDLPQLTAD